MRGVGGWKRLKLDNDVMEEKKTTGVPNDS